MAIEAGTPLGGRLWTRARLEEASRLAARGGKHGSCGRGCEERGTWRKKNQGREDDSEARAATFARIAAESLRSKIAGRHVQDEVEPPHKSWRCFAMEKWRLINQPPPE